MSTVLISGTANRPLAQAIADRMAVPLAACTLVRFPDGELGVKTGTLHGADVFIVQPTGPPVDEHLVELCLIADACRRTGAARVTAVIPYFGYARQDRRGRDNDSVSARMAAGFITLSGVDRVVLVDAHSRSMEGFFGVPVEHLSAIELIVERLRGRVSADAVVVAPDLGAAKLAERCARSLGLPVAFVHKSRVSGTDVEIHGVTGDVAHRPVLIVDDMISTGATIVAAANAVLSSGALPQITVAAVHGLFVSMAGEWLRALNPQQVVVSDSVPQRPDAHLPLTVVPLAGLLAAAIARLSTAGTLGPATVR